MTNKKAGPGDSWRTPKEVINFIESRFGKIKIDLCSSDENKVCELNLTESDDFLDDEWLTAELINKGELAWMNCPYSNPLPFVKQAIKFCYEGYAVAGILNLDPSTRWFVELVKNASIIMPIISGRIAFIDSDGYPVDSNNKPQVMFFMEQYTAGDASTKYVHIDTIYPHGKPAKRPKKSKKLACHEKTPEKILEEGC